LHGVQLWTALPDQTRNVEPAFDHYPSLPIVEEGGFRITVLAGQLGGTRSPAAVYAPLSGFDIHGLGDGDVSLDPEFEYAASVAVTKARNDWEAGRHFTGVTGFPGPRIPAPPLPPGRLKPRR
jgi:redox-sensitive bicupin YhaK (pirin superfamily)